MSSPPKNLLSYLRVIVAAWRDDPRDDAELLAHFVETRDEAAFATLVGRHGPLVWQTCRRILGDTPDAEDAFQATFLALARKAGRFPVENLAGWLHRVARQAALDARVGARRRRGLEQRLRAVTQPNTEENASRAELYAALDEELVGLPERLRVPLLLHYLEGRSQVEVARLLGCARSVLQKRLTQGEAILRQRLERRGLAVGFVSVGVLLGSTVTAPALQARLIGSTVRVALRSLSFPPPLESGQAVALAEGVMKTMLVTKMKIITVLLGLTLCLAGGGVLAYQALAGNAAEPLQPAGETRGEVEVPTQGGAGGRATARVDCYGDPLPKHALARMGTVRQWYGRLNFTPKTVFAFSDDKTLVSQNCERPDRSVWLWDAATGREIRRIASTKPADYDSTLLALSPDGQTLAKAQSGAEGKEGTVYLWEVATGKLLHQLKSHGPKRKAFFLGITFLPNGKILTLDYGDYGDGDNRIYLWDVATGGREISQLMKSQRKDSNVNSEILAFSRDGKMLATAESVDDNKEKKITISLWEVATGKKIRQLTRENASAVCSLAFSPDGKTLASGGNGVREIHVWDVATGKLIHLLKSGGTGFSCPLAYSPDGKTLVGGRDGHLWDVATGKEIRSFGWEDAKVAVFSPNGKTLAVGDEAGVIRLWDVTTGKEILPHKGHQDRVRSIAYSPDGKTLASVSQDKTVRLWEVMTGKEIRQLAKNTHWWGNSSLAYSPDGKMLASIDNALHLWDTATGKELHQFLRGKAGDHPQSVTFSPDGKLLAATQGDHTVYVWKVATDKLIYTLYTLSRELRGGAGEPWSVAFSPDSRMLAVPGKGRTVSLWEAATGKQIGQLQLEQDSRKIRSLAFSPDGRILATSSEGQAYRGQQEQREDDKAHLWEVASGKEIGQLKDPKDNWQGGWLLAFSPDSRILATVDETANAKKIHLWEVASGKEIGQLSGHRSTVRCVAFSPDGKTLASGSDDLTCLIWDVTSFGSRLKPAPVRPLSEKQLEAAWTDLAKDPAKAYAAVRALQAAPEQAIPLLRERVRPVAPVADLKQLKRWIADLDANNFTVRDKAQQEIKKLGEAALPALRQAWKDQPTLELKRRLQDLLAELEPKVVIVSPQRIRELRAVQVLESIGTVEARQVLQACAKGVAGVRLTQEAQAALDRLIKRSAARP